MQALDKLTNRKESKEEDSGQIGSNEKELLPEHLTQQVLGTYLIQKLGRDSK